jgi:hypothetical protein
MNVFNYPGLQPGVKANPELTGALAQMPTKVQTKPIEYLPGNRWFTLI